MSAYSSLTRSQQEVLQILIKDTNAKQTITGANLMKRSTYIKKEAGGMRQIIHALRIKGFPICANGRGYFYARTNEDLSKFIVKLQARVISQEQALKGLKESFHNVGHQILGKMVNDEGKTVDVKIMVRKAVRNSNNSVTYMDFTLGPDGNPIIPAGVELL